MEKKSSNYSIMSDVEIEHQDLSLESFDKMLSDQDEQLLNQINDLQTKIDGKHDLMADLLNAVKKGAIDYVDSMTDTGETFNKAKDPDAVKSLNDIEIDKRNKPADKESNDNWATRKMSDAKTNPFDLNVDGNTNGMSESGRAKFKRYNEAYKQRLKTNTITSNGENNVIRTSDPQQNLESLSGLRNYRVGPVVAMPDIEGIKEGYQKAVSEGKAYSTSGYIRKVNFDTFDEVLVEKFGFKSKSEARRWRESNHLTIHESGDGMFLVPTDVHDSSSHKGYCSMLSDILKGKEGAEKAMEQYKLNEKVAYVKHEARIRGVRAVKGVGMAIVKDFLKHVITNLITTFYDKTKLIKEQGFLNYVKAVLLSTWEKVKSKAMNILKNIGANIKGAIVTELLNAVNDFFLGTFKRIFSVIRQMLGSIKRALKVLCDRNRSWQEKVFEAAKILSAGGVAIIGFSLNEIIEKGLMGIGVPSSIASFVAECLSGLFAGIFSNIVLMLFDNTKESWQVKNAQLKLSLLRTQSLFIENLRLDVSVLKTSRDICDTYYFFGNSIAEIEGTRNHILTTEDRIKALNEDTQKILGNNTHFNDLITKLGNDDEF